MPANTKASNEKGPSMGVAESFDRALRSAGVPIRGVSIGREDDRATWRVTYTPEATDEQRATGENVRQTFSVSDPAVIAADADAKAQADIDGMKATKATVICGLWGRLGRQPTAAEIAAERARWLAIYKAL